MELINRRALINEIENMELQFDNLEEFTANLALIIVILDIIEKQKVIVR